MRPGLVNYFGFLLRPFFKSWWPVLTGIASIFSVVVTPQSGFVLGQAVVAILTLVGMTVLFFAGSAIVQGWQLYQQRYPDLRVSAVQKTKDYDGDFVVLLIGNMEVSAGTLVELRRLIGETDTLFALVEVRNRTVQGNYLGVPVWTSAGHQKDLNAGKFLPSELVVIPYVQRESLARLQSSP